MIFRILEKISNNKKDFSDNKTSIEEKLKSFSAAYSSELIEKVKRPKQIKEILVIIPCFNHGIFLDDTLKSISWQSFRGKIRVVLVDDCSTDNSLQMMKNLKKLYSERMDIEIIHNKKNILQIGCINKVVEKYNSDLFMVLNADDLLVPNCIDLTIDTYNRNKDIFMLGGSSEWFNSADGFPEYNKKTIGKLKLKKYGPKDALNFNDPNSINMSQSSCSFFKSAWSLVGGYFPLEKRICQFDDRDFQMRVCSLLPIGIYEDYPMMFYRTDSSLGRGTI